VPLCSHRAIARGALRALAYCHEAGVIHGALGSGSLMLSTFDDRAADRLIVKLDNVRLGLRQARHHDI
jgi:serine/threonine protein kinase